MSAFATNSMYFTPFMFSNRCMNSSIRLSDCESVSGLCWVQKSSSRIIAFGSVRLFPLNLKVFSGISSKLKSV